MDVLLHQLQGAQQTGGDHNGGAVLVIGDVQFFLQAAFDLKAAGCADIFQVDAAEGGSQILDGFHDLVRVFGVQADGERVDVCKRFEQDGLALHDRHGGFRADVTQTQHRRAIRHDRHQIALGGVAVDLFLIVPNLAAGFCNAGSVSSGQVIAGLDLNLRGDRDLALVGFVHFECELVVIHGAFLLFPDQVFCVRAAPLLWP